jgi:hypothetical protein
MSTKLCSVCQKEQPEGDYSGAQLKKKGKRVCRHCVGGGGAAAGGAGAGGAAPSSSAAAQQLAALLSAHSARNGGPRAGAAAAVADATSPVVELGPDPAPPHPLFPDQRSALWDAPRGIAFYSYSSEEKQLPLMQRLIEADLSEPYSIFTYRYFLNFWPQLSFMVRTQRKLVAKGRARERFVTLSLSVVAGGLC